MKTKKNFYKNKFLYVGLVVMLITTSLLFEFQVVVKRKPLLEKVIGLVWKSQPLEDTILPSAGIVLPIHWGDIGQNLINYGVIDKEKLEILYQSRGGLSEQSKKLLESDAEITMTAENAGELLNLLWAFGLSNRNDILTNGPMQDPQYGGAGNFASTGGWTLAKGEAMDHYSMHSLLSLTQQQQALVEKVSKNIYRPCCGNSTYFPDCNHGMAMLGLLELMAAQGVDEETMYRVALQVNAYWFPDTYITIAKYLNKNGSSWEKAGPKQLLGFDYSSGPGYQKILAQVEPPDSRQGGSCGV